MSQASVALSCRLVFRSVRTLAKSGCQRCHVCPSVCPSVRSNSAPTGRSFTKFNIRFVEENLSRKFKFYLNQKRITGTLHDDRHTFVITSRSVLLRVRNVSDKSCRENQNTHFVFNNAWFGNRAVYEIMCINNAEQDRAQMSIWRMRIACWIPKATNTHTQNM